MEILIVLTDSPDTSSRCRNALQLAQRFVTEEPETPVTVFLTEDAVICAKRTRPGLQGLDDIRSLLEDLLARRVRVRLTGVDIDSRGLSDDDILDGAERSTRCELFAAVARADRMLGF